MLSKKHSLAKTSLANNDKVTGYGTLRSSRAARQLPAKSSEAARSAANGRAYGLEEGVSRSLVTTAAAFDPGELSNWRFFLCSLCLAGVQFTWTVEFAYGSPYLLDLGLSKPLMSLVWLAGPLSGLLVAPVIGAYSDHLRSRLGRRRPFMLVGAAMVVASLMIIGFARQLAFYLVVVILDMPMQNPQSEVVGATRHAASMLAVVGFYILDFSVNTVQTSCRALILDSAPAHQQGLANSWAGRMIGLGNVLGYFVGFLDLPQLLPFLGDGQVSVLCSVASIVLCLTVMITSISVKEMGADVIVYQVVSGRKPHAALVEMLETIRRMPYRVQQVCNIQFFAWFGWFPVLFYSTMWVTEVMARGEHLERSEDFFERATRAGSFSLLLFAIVALVSSILLPLVFPRCAVQGDRPSQGGGRVANISPSDVWAASHFLFAALMFSTLFVGSDVRAAQYILAGCGICWAVAMWVPFALVGTEMRHAEAATGADAQTAAVVFEEADTVPGGGGNRHNNSGRAYHAAGGSRPPPNAARDDDGSVPRALSAGLLLGIHNVYIVVPQFVTSLVAAAIFATFAPAVPANQGPPPGDDLLPGGANFLAGAEVDSVGWVLRMGGVSGFVAGVLTRARL